MVQKVLATALAAYFSIGACKDETPSASVPSKDSTDYKHYADFKSTMQKAGKTPVDFKDFMKDYDKYLNFEKYLKSKDGQNPVDVEDFVKEYEKYMSFKKYTAQGKDDQPTMDFGSFMDFEKEMRAGQEGHGSKVPSDYQKFLSDYQKFMDFKHYISTRDAPSASSNEAPVDFQAVVDNKDQASNSGPFDFQKYMNFGSGSKDGSNSMDFKQYMDFSKYMKGFQSSQGGPADFQKYMNFNEYMNQGKQVIGQGKDLLKGFPSPLSMAATDDDKSAATGDEPKSKSGEGFGDFQKFMGGGDSNSLGGATSDFQKYMDYSKYMGISHQYTEKDWMSKWQEFQQEGQAGQGQQVPYSATDCKTVEQLNAWHDKQLSITKEWIPKMFQGPTLDSIEKDYQSNLERLQNPPAPETSSDAGSYTDTGNGMQGSSPVSLAATPPSIGGGAEPAYLMSADKCETTAQLNAWRLRQQTQLSKYVPKDYQTYSLAPIEAEYAKQLKRIESKAAAIATQAMNSASNQAQSSAAVAISQSDMTLAKATNNLNELVAWRADVGWKIDQLPAEERARWDAVANKEMEAGLSRLQMKESKKKSSNTKAKASKTDAIELAEEAAPTSSHRFSRLLLVSLLAFALPVAGMHVFNSFKEARSRGTDYDASFIALDGRQETV